MNLTHFKRYNKNDVLSLTRLRRFETKIGERVEVLNDGDIAQAVKNLSAQYVIVGIPEDIGVQANYGTGGASTAWLSFLQAFLNAQSNDFLSGEDVAVIGHFDFGDVQFLIDKNAYGQEEKVEAYRHAVNGIDEEVEGLIKMLVAEEKTPIVIGGGHNNAYPLLKGTAKGLHAAGIIELPQINCINLDAHTDYRPSEGRHSGNGFRYAEEDGFLQKYCVLGVHESYLPQNVWIDIVNNPFLDIITYEDIFIHEKRNFRQAVTHAVDFTSDNHCGIEIDLDCVQNILSSASTPSGVQAIHARQYVNLCAAHTKAAYLHIAEGATQLANGTSNNLTGKFIQYLVTDFIKMNGEL
ncbi:arginase family protein [Flavisolibacter ginsenosidimutans]|uniref:Arginase n=1 Tax=Flavisolibacter ginsenosidimutans TaxID=661481 RepID=A0A5B8UF69_9BACT|nr:arginase family protein [Flavisolibacter ginsenosidimutans]QEC55082.1 arginase [Flavisolibacter ginsenosidimutans]